MAKKRSIRKNKINDYDFLKCLQNDPTKSIREIAKELKSHRQTLWRKKKNLEENKFIWGYTAIIDDIKLNRVVYLVLMKMKSMTKELINILMKRIIENQPAKYDVQLIDAFHVIGEFDWIIKFSSPDRTTAGKYYDYLRSIYNDFLLEKPIIIDIHTLSVKPTCRIIF